MLEHDQEDLLLDYLYEDLSPVQREALRRQIEGCSQSESELKSLLQMRRLVAKHLPQEEVSSRLTQKLLVDLGIRKPWYQTWTSGFFKPVLAGVMLLFLTLGGVRYYRSEESALRSPVATVASSLHQGGEDLRILQREPVWRESWDPPTQALVPLQSSLVPAWRGQRGGRSAYPQTGVSLVGFHPGSSEVFPSDDLLDVSDPDIEKLEVQAQQSVGQFMHRQALKMRAMGDCQAAAQQLGNLIKTYPFYPLKMEVMAQRVDCLFRSGQSEVAQNELKILKELSAPLAYLVERRWSRLANP